MLLYDYAIGDWVCTETLKGHESTVWGLAFHPSGARFASCSDDKSIIVWKHDPQNPSVCEEDGKTM